MNNSSVNTVTIPLSKQKISLAFLGSLLFVLGGFWLVAISEFEQIIILLGGIISILFFGVCGLFAVYKMFDASPGLILDEQGLVDNSSGASVGRVLWEDITQFSVAQISGQKFLTLHVSDAKKYIERGNAFQKKINAANNSSFGSPIQISSKALKIDFDKLVKLVAEHHERHRYIKGN